jgi:hypothetical protein
MRLGEDGNMRDGGQYAELNFVLCKQPERLTSMFLWRVLAKPNA